MTIVNEDELTQSSRAASPRTRMRMLDQMAEALEDEADALYRRAAAFEEDEFSLNREIEERQTKINRLQLKLEGLRSERAGLIGKIETLRVEAAAIREEIFNNEEEIALAAIEGTEMMEEIENPDWCQPAVAQVRRAPHDGSVFFHRMTLSDRAKAN